MNIFKISFFFLILFSSSYLFLLPPFFVFYPCLFKLDLLCSFCFSFFTSFATASLVYPVLGLSLSLQGTALKITSSKYFQKGNVLMLPHTHTHNLQLQLQFNCVHIQLTSSHLSCNHLSCPCFLSPFHSSRSPVNSFPNHI